MTVLITGGGLVGCQIARLEQEAGRAPVIFDFSPRTEALGEFVDLERCTVVRGDVTNPLELVATVTGYGITRIIHTAAFGGLTAGSNTAPLASTLVNTMGTAYVLEVARVLGLERVVLCSSSTLYMSMEGGADEGRYGLEEAYPRPNNVYAANKQAAEDLGRAYRKTYGLDVVAVRFAAVFGPWGPGGGGGATTAMERWLRSSMAGEPAEVNISGADWIYSKDAAQGTFKACWAEGLEAELFNLGMGQPYSAREIADGINAVIPGECAKESARAIDPRRPAMNIERARQQLGYEVEYPMAAAVRDYHEWITRR
ncbi:NAD-dependent epimerase/dehydratase family protein [Pseudofrankia inefficax]|uniref:NAD-dependent epimerase/dehydratase n=1 Tax=Pseudofrankia inefficax (strain DSM 45817 / CECT 9037 / DDB 130130 / EuI1c) TaxID=298654 RepID=E3J7S0_PSEI1|nr:NAD(P)-dependent oxidoreductase [Pseudofrankia inefficax]ADP80824.1 NAD-dependent epimerase/dehydratase [Pseudofrankia inefficax]